MTLSSMAQERLFTNKSAIDDIEMLSPGGYMATGIYLTALGIVATFGNAFVIVVVVLRRMLCKSFNHLIFNLALADLCVAVSSYPLTAASGFAERWLFGHFGCIISAYVIFMLSMVSINTLLVIAVFRYTFICKPQYNYLTSIQYMKYVIGGIWGHAIIWTAFPLVGWSNYLLEPFGTSCTLNWRGSSFSEASYSVASLITCYVLHVSVITFCYIKIIFKARSLQFGVKSDQGFFEMEKVLLYQKLQVERNVTRICIVMVVAFFTVWTPYALFSLLSVLKMDLPIAVTCLPTMFAKLSCALNPIIYTAGSSRFRHALLSILPGRGSNTSVSLKASPKHRDWLFSTMGDPGPSSRDEESSMVLSEQKTVLPGRNNFPLQQLRECRGDMTKNGIYIGPIAVNIDVQSSAF